MSQTHSIVPESTVRLVDVMSAWRDQTDGAHDPPLQDSDAEANHEANPHDDREGKLSQIFSLVSESTEFFLRGRSV